MPISGGKLKDKALEFAKRFGENDFKLIKNILTNMAAFPPIKVELDPPKSMSPPDKLASLDEGKSKKKKKLTKEERKELKRQNLLLKKKKELEDRKQQFRDHLERELKYTDITYQRAAADWEAMCGAIKSKELLDDMTDLWQSLNRALDSKNFKIRRLLNELNIAEEQYRRNFSMHADVLEYLINLFRLFINATRDAYAQDAVDLVADFQRDVEEKNEIHESRKKYYVNVLHATNLITACKLDKMQTCFTINGYEIMDTHVVKRLHSRDLAVRKMERLQANTEKIIADLQRDAVSSKHEQIYNQRLKRQEQLTKEIKACHEAYQRLYATINMQKAKLLNCENEVNTKVAKLRGERSYYAEYYWQLKQSHTDDLKACDEHIKCLAVESDKTLKRLQKLTKYGELVLSLAACCRKFQTEKEKVTPWTEDAFAAVVEPVKQIDDSQDPAMAIIRSMHLFWNRVGQAEAHVLCLREEKQALEKENGYFRDIIKAYGDAQEYNKIICSLRISPYPTIGIPIQEASQMPHLIKGKKTIKRRPE